jgi:hypothetical protein
VHEKGAAGEPGGKGGGKADGGEHKVHEHTGQIEHTAAGRRRPPTWPSPAFPAALGRWRFEDAGRARGGLHADAQHESRERQRHDEHHEAGGDDARRWRPPVEQQGGPKPVTVANKVPVSFNAVQTMASVTMSTDIKPFGVGAGIAFGVGFGSINAFKGGGDVPEDMLAKLHNREMVLPVDIAEPFRAAIRRPGGITIGQPALSAPRSDVGAGATAAAASTSASSATPSIVEEHHHHWDVKANDAASFQDMLQRHGKGVIEKTASDVVSRREKTAGRRF